MNNYGCLFCFNCRSFFGNINFFGGPSSTSVKASAKLQQIEEENQDAMFIVLSDVWLDQIKVGERFDDEPPSILLVQCSLVYPTPCKVVGDHR